MDKPLMDESLVAPCGMNCAVCISYLAMKHDLNRRGLHRKYCPGCRPRGQHCVFMRAACEKIGTGQIRYCFECAQFPCKRLKRLDKRYRSRYHLSMIDNLNLIRENGISAFLHRETVKWTCPDCGDVICCHVGLCLHCQLGLLRKNPRYRWDNDPLDHQI